jgi:hypothetical protein
MYPEGGYFQKLIYHENLIIQSFSKHVSDCCYILTSRQTHCLNLDDRTNVYMILLIVNNFRNIIL